jgi:HPt (histidine-containing phosphotransfer) domain-containing protein/CheY-like chemotaxis protein
MGDELLQAVRKALGLITIAEEESERQAGHGSADEAAAAIPPLHVLLTDDNAFNQKVGVLKLQKYGHTVVVAGSGREALARLEQEKFDLVLMDVQMPEMDGFEATGIIRTREKETGQHMPIIAMTGRAMKGDREQCLAAGMDGYVTKPVQDAALWQAIREVLPAELLNRPRSSSVPAVAPVAAVEASAGVVLDRAVLVARIGGNEKLLNELVEVFREDCGKLVPELRAALLEGDAARLGEAAHSLKGMVAFFGVESATEAARHLEKLGRQGDLSAAQDALGRLSHELDRLDAGLAALLAPTARAAPAAATAPVELVPGEPLTLDPTLMLTRVGGDQNLLRELVEVFCQDCPRMMNEIADAIRSGNATVLNDTAHSLKGMIAFFGIRSATSAALKLETLGRQGDLGQAQTAYAELVREVARLQDGLKPLVEPGAEGTVVRPELRPAVVHEQALPDAGEPATVDTTIMLSRLGGDQNLLRELLDAFLQDCPRLLGEIRDAIQAGDATALNEAAHSLKGMLAFFEVHSVTAAALRLEALGREGNLSEAMAAFRDLEKETTRLQVVLSNLMEQPAASG